MGRVRLRLDEEMHEPTHVSPRRLVRPAKRDSVAQQVC